MRIPLKKIIAEFSRSERKMRRDLAKQFSQIGRLSVPAFKNMLPFINFEMMRARRYQHPLSLLVLTAKPRHLTGGSQSEGPDLLQLPNKKIATKMVLSLIASIIGENLRGCDLLAHDVQSDRIILILVETAAEGAQKAAMRLSQLLIEQIQLPVEFGIAEFPKDSLTIDELIRVAEGASRSHLPLSTNGTTKRRPSDEEVDDPRILRLS